MPKMYDFKTIVTMLILAFMVAIIVAGYTKLDELVNNPKSYTILPSSVGPIMDCQNRGKYPVLIETKNRFVALYECSDTYKPMIRR